MTGNDGKMRELAGNDGDLPGGDLVDLGVKIVHASYVYELLPRYML